MFRACNSGRMSRAGGEAVCMDEFARCAVCLRTPLVGERVAVLGRGGRESAVCELCEECPRAAALGEALRRERVRSAAGAAAVRRLSPAAAPMAGAARLRPPSGREPVKAGAG